MLQKIGWRYMLRRPLLTLLCVLGVSLGVSVIIAIDLANTSASAAFKLSTDTVSGRATHQIVSASGVVGQELYAKLRLELGLREIAPVIEAYATAPALDRQPLHVLGVDVFSEPPFRSYLAQGQAALQSKDFSSFLSRADTFVLSRGFAEQYGLAPGAVISLQVGGREKSLTLVGLVEPADASSKRALDGLALVDIGTAQSLFGMPGLISHIDLIADERTPAGRAVLARLRDVLPAGIQIVKPEARSQSIENLTDAFELNLSALSLLALVVGVFLIYNTITFSVLQRRPLFGTLRCLGVTRDEIFLMVLGEAVLFGVLGGALGIVLGLVLGRGSVRLVTQTINDLYYVVNVRNVEINPLILGKGFVLGLVASVVAACAPAFEATRIEPVTALRRSNIEGTVRTIVPKVALAGLGMAAAGTLALLLTPILTINFAGIFGIVVGAALVAPLFTVWFMRIALPVMNTMAGAIGRMAARAVINSLSRTAVAIASLTIAVSVIIGLQSMIGSFRTTVETWLGATLVADVYVRPSGGGRNTATNFIDQAAVDSLRAMPGVIGTNTYRQADVDFSVIQSSSVTHTALLLAEDTDAIRPVDTLKWTDLPGNWTDQWNELRNHEDVLVSEPLANKYGIDATHARLVLLTNSGLKEVRVRGIYFDYGSEQGVILMSRQLYEKYWNDAKVGSMALFVDQATAQSIAPFVNRLRQNLAGTDLVVTANSDLRANALGVFDRTFAITGALNLLATLVSFIGVLSALMAMQLERTRELGVLRANGMTLGQMARMMLFETGLIGGTAGLLSMPTGFALAVVLVRVINLRAFGWTIQMQFSPSTYMQAFCIALGSALLATIYPIVKLNQMQIAQAVRQE